MSERSNTPTIRLDSEDSKEVRLNPLSHCLINNSLPNSFVPFTLRIHTKNVWFVHRHAVQCNAMPCHTMPRYCHTQKPTQRATQRHHQCQSGRLTAQIERAQLFRVSDWRIFVLISIRTDNHLPEFRMLGAHLLCVCVCVFGPLLSKMKTRI